jgi:initiation factor 1A
VCGQRARHSARASPKPRSFRAHARALTARRAGNGRLEAQCIDGVKRLCHIRGKMRKKVWVNTVRGLLPFPFRNAAYPLFRFRRSLCGRNN